MTATICCPLVLVLLPSCFFVHAKGEIVILLHPSGVSVTYCVYAVFYYFGVYQDVIY